MATLTNSEYPDEILHNSTAFHQGLYYSKTCVKRPLSKRLNIGLYDQLSLKAGQKYCRMLQVEQVH